MPPFQQVLINIMWSLIGALPWLIGIAVFTWSPLGRLLGRFLKDRRHSDQLLEANNEELAELNRALNAMVERLDATERTIARLGRESFEARGVLPPAGLVTPVTPTPH